MTRDRLAWVVVLSAVGMAGCTASKTPRQGTNTQGSPSGFVGSPACQRCHDDIYTRWQTTLMANVVHDPKQEPEAILADFSTPNPLVTFTRDDIAFTYGSKWKQRYWKKQGNDYFVLPAQWDVRNKVWRPYHVQAGTDWWVPYYPAQPGDNTTRPTGALCDGCHSVNYDIKTHTATELKVGCERCHGAGAAHAADPTKTNIVNPARLDDVRSNDVCIQCHSQGQPLANPIDGRYYDWAVGYQPGDRLSDTWKLEDHRLGETTFTHWPDSSAHKNRMQGNDYVGSRMYEKGVRCYACHDPHGTGQDALLKFAGNEMCLQCHGPRRQAGPGVTAETHSHHSTNSEGNQCVACHMPKIATTIADVSVRSHTFTFVSPTMTEKYGIPNPCTSCHKDKTSGWATEALNQWSNVSPWRMAR